VVLAAVVIFRSYQRNRPGRLRKYAQSITDRQNILFVLLFILCLAGAAAFEVYYNVYRCRVSDNYMRDHVRILHETTAALESHQIVYWADYSTLLKSLRGDDVNPWDYQEHFSMLYPGEERLEWLLAALRPGEHMMAVMDNSKDVIRVSLKKRRGPVVNIWLWHYIKDMEGRSLLVTSDPYVEYRFREPAEIFPTQNRFFVGKNVSVPLKGHLIAQKQYGPRSSYTPSEVSRSDCFTNFFHLRFFY